MKYLKEKLNICMFVNFLTLLLICLPVFYFNNGKSSYFKFGWCDDLVLISVPINTITKYIIVCLYIAGLKATNCLINEIVSPIIGFRIYNPDKKYIQDFTKNELQLYGNIYYMICGFKRLMLIMISITQIDLAMIGMLSGEIMSFFTIRMLLNEKIFENDNNKYYKINPENAENEQELIQLF